MAILNKKVDLLSPHLGGLVVGAGLKVRRDEEQRGCPGNTFVPKQRPGRGAVCSTNAECDC